METQSKFSYRNVLGELMYGTSKCSLTNIVLVKSEMSGTNFSVPFAMKGPIDYSKAQENGQQQYNHRNNYENFITQVKPRCYTGVTEETGIVIQKYQFNGYECSNDDVYYFVPEERNIILEYMLIGTIPDDIAIASKRWRVCNHQTLQ